MDNQLAMDCMNNIWNSGVMLSHFYSFSLNNPHLSFWQKAQIFAVRPDVKFCKSYDDWKYENDRQVSRGARGIPYFDENNPSVRKHVFDISQTYGKNSVPLNKYRLNEQQLFEAVNGQNEIPTTILETEDNIKAAVYQYCKDNYGYSSSDEKEEEYLACLTEGITSSLYEITDNNREPDVASLPFDNDTNIKLCQEVVNITNGLLDAIREKSRRIKNERTNQERSAKLSSRATDNRESIKSGKQSAGVQQSLWDFAAELYNGSLSVNIHDAFDERTTARRTEQSGFGVQEISGQPVSDIEQTAFTFFDLPRESPSLARNREENRGVNLERSDLPTAYNYRLTEKNFIYDSGAKTRYKNNITAIRLMFALENEKRHATEDEKSILAKYVGWGGLASAFDNNNTLWANEYKELKELLPEGSYRRANESVLTSYYTDKNVIDGVYAALKKLGLTSGKILEPAMGIGNFIGLLPDSFKASNVYGVEIDDITGRIAKLLYPETQIHVKGFEQTNFANNSFDAVVTNVPFGAFKVFDTDYNKQDFFIHNYFIAKSLDKVRPGGIIAVITTKGTMDKEGTDVRQYIANRAELLGAVRLPNNAFKNSANTEVTSDILFLSKRDKIIDSTDDWIYTTRYPIKTIFDELTNSYLEKEIPINSYFASNPEMMLGTMAQHKSMYGDDNETELMPDGRILSEAIVHAIEHLPANVYEIKNIIQSSEKVAAAVLPADENVKNFCFQMFDGKVYQRVNDTMLMKDIAHSNLGRMEDMITLRCQVRQLLNIQINNCTDEELKTEQNKLSTLYNRFIREYGLINSRTNRNIFRDDADYALLISVEDVDEISGTATKTDIFTKRTIQPYMHVFSCDNAVEALGICKSECGIVDIKFIEQLTKKSYDEIIKELDGYIFQNPEDTIFGDADPYNGWQISSEYLSGNVRSKLTVAQQAAKIDENYIKNVNVLSAVQPLPLMANEISTKIGATWIDAHYYKKFVCELLKLDKSYWDYINIRFEPLTGTWLVKRDSSLRYDMNANQIFGTARMDAYKILEHCLNQQTPSIYDNIKDSDGNEQRVLNKPETTAVREKQHKLQQAFKDWIFDDQKRRTILVDNYNEIFNNTVLPKFDGSYLKFPEMNPLITLKDYQKDAVDRMLVSGNTLLHHVVGSGKTFEISAAAMKMRQLGIAKKPMIVVPNHLVVQWANEFRTLYPNANLLIATKKDFEKENRKKFVAKVALGDWDSIIIASSSFEKIPISQKRQQQKINDEIDAVTACIARAKDNHGERSTVKNLQRILKNKEAILKKLTDDSKKDDLLIFEDLGVDALFVDEAHRYKNKFIFTKMNNVSGLSKAMSQRASDMDMKCEYINELRGGNKGVVFATGTPISNSMVEMFTMQSYLQRDELKNKGMEFFDGWAANFGETQTALELAPSGQGYRTRTRFAKFTNLPELLKMYRSFADVKTADMLNLPTPTAEKITVNAKPSDEILLLNDKIVERAEDIALGKVSPEEDNMLCITHDGKKIALDPRCYDPTLSDNPMNKVNTCVNNIYKIWLNSVENKSTQIAFCDMSTPKCSFEDYNPIVNFDVYNDIKTKLINMGIPNHEIAFIHDANTDTQKQSLFDKVRHGDIRVLIGSTEKCGAGTNIQNKLIALHHLDTPYRPSDLEQREGRIIRQGNENPIVQIFTYVTERTFDSYSYQILENKQKFISQINQGDLSVREASDIDETTLSYAEIKAITAANPKIKRKMEIEQEVSRLRTLEWQHKQTRYSMQDRIVNLPKEIKRQQLYIDNLLKDIELRDQNRSNEFSIKIGANTYSERKDGGDLLLSVVNSQKYIDKVVGKFCGFDIVPCPRDNLFESLSVKLIGANSYNVLVSESGVGTATRLENFIRAMEENLSKQEQKKVTILGELDQANIEVDKPFEYSAQLESLSCELSSIDAELDLGREETPIVLENESEVTLENPTIEVEHEDYAAM